MGSRANDAGCSSNKFASSGGKAVRVVSCASAAIALVIAQSPPAEAFDLGHLFKHHAVRLPHASVSHAMRAPMKMRSAPALTRSFSAPKAESRSFNTGREALLDRPYHSDRTYNSGRANPAPRANETERSYSSARAQPHIYSPGQNNERNRSYFTGAAYTPPGANFGSGGFRSSGLAGLAGPLFSGFGFLHNPALAWPFLGLAVWQLANFAALSEPELRSQQNAMIGATSGPINSPQVWNDQNASGSVTPLREGRAADGALCREFEQMVTVDGQQQQAIGTACQEEDGTWQIVDDDTGQQG
jgi:17 kDa outer membrane surface antigen